MKTLLFIGALVAFALAVPTSREQWEQFKKEHGKSYENLEHEQERLEIFSSNLKRIEEHNDKYKAGLVSYYVKINRFADMRPEEVSALSGLNRTGLLSNHKPEGLQYLPPANVDLPESIDWREKGAVTAIKNQGSSCGSCWAFSTTGSLEGQVFRKTGKLVSLSEQQLLDCSSSFGNQGCQGGLMDSAFAYIEEGGGVESEESYPYEEEEKSCRFKSDKVVEGTAVKSVVDIPEGDDKALQAAVATVGPISVAVSADNFGFRYYGGGTFSGDTCTPSKLDHGVIVVGYGSESGKDFWIVKNSWSKQWGDQGYMKLERKRNICGISTMASYPVL